jgi:hypothetical protein
VLIMQHGAAVLAIGEAFVIHRTLNSEQIDHHRHRVRLTLPRDWKTDARRASVALIGQASRSVTGRALLPAPVASPS